MRLLIERRTLWRQATNTDNIETIQQQQIPRLKDQTWNKWGRIINDLPI